MQWTLLLCFVFPLSVYIFLYMHMWKHGCRCRPGFLSFRLPSHSQIRLPLTVLSPEISLSAQSPTPGVSRPQICVLKNADMEKYISVSYTYQLRDLFWGGTLKPFSFLGRFWFLKCFRFPSKIFPPKDFLFAIKEMVTFFS